MPHTQSILSTLTHTSAHWPASALVLSQWDYWCDSSTPFKWAHYQSTYDGLCWMLKRVKRRGGEKKDQDGRWIELEGEDGVRGENGENLSNQTRAHSKWRTVLILNDKTWVNKNNWKWSRKRTGAAFLGRLDANGCEPVATATRGNGGPTFPRRVSHSDAIGCRQLQLGLQPMGQSHWI